MLNETGKELLPRVARRLIAELAKQEPDAVVRYVGKAFNSYAKDTDGWNPAFCKPLHNLAKFLEKSK